MVTVVNTPPGGEAESSGVGLIVGIILAIVIIALFFIYGLPALRGSTPAPQNTQDRNIDINVDLPNTPAQGGNTQNPGTGGNGTPSTPAQ